MVKNLKKIRNNFDISQETLGKSIGVSGRQIYTYERQKNEPDIGTLTALADFFGVSIDYLVGRDEHSVVSKEFSSSLVLTKFGDRITAARTNKSLTSKSVASMVGITKTYYDLIEKGVKIPKFETAIKIMNVLEVSADEILMDSVDGASEFKATYLQNRLSTLPPKKRSLILKLLESIIETVNESSP